MHRSDEAAGLAKQENGGVIRLIQSIVRDADQSAGALFGGSSFAEVTKLGNLALGRHPNIRFQ
jgi:hypothetical protein